MEGRDESCASHSEGRKTRGKQGVPTICKEGVPLFDTEERRVLALAKIS
jgi:hypothetical protein